jgi:hypothetical protein
MPLGFPSQVLEPPAIHAYPVIVSDYGDLSREAELEAVSIIGSYFGSQGTVLDTGKTAAYDFEIQYADTRTAVGEVSVLEDKDYLSGRDAMLRQETVNLHPLPDGYGFWRAKLRKSDKTAHIGSFLKQITSYIEKLKVENIEDLDIEEDWPKTPLYNLGRRLGIMHIRKVKGMEGDQIFYNYQGSGGFRPTTSEPLICEIEELLHDGQFQTSWTKLLPFPADEKHIFFKCGSLISDHLHDYFIDTNTSHSMTNFRFPKGITHLWLTSRWQKHVTLLWISDGQKIMIR